MRFPAPNKGRQVPSPATGLRRATSPGLWPSQKVSVRGRRPMRGPADRRVCARGRCVKHCRERMQIIRFCAHGAKRPFTFTAAPGSRARKRSRAESSLTEKGWDGLPCRCPVFRSLCRPDGGGQAEGPAPYARGGPLHLPGTFVPPGMGVAGLPCRVVLFAWVHQFEAAGGAEGQAGDRGLQAGGGVDPVQV